MIFSIAAGTIAIIPEPDGKIPIAQLDLRDITLKKVNTPEKAQPHSTGSNCEKRPLWHLITASGDSNHYRRVPARSHPCHRCCYYFRAQAQ